MEFCASDFYINPLSAMAQVPLLPSLHPSFQSLTNNLQPVNVSKRERERESVCASGCRCVCVQERERKFVEIEVFLDLAWSKKIQAAGIARRDRLVTWLRSSRTSSFSSRVDKNRMKEEKSVLLTKNTEKMAPKHKCFLESGWMWRWTVCQHGWHRNRPFVRIRKRINSIRDCFFANVIYKNRS